MVILCTEKIVFYIQIYQENDLKAQKFFEKKLETKWTFNVEFWLLLSDYFTVGSVAHQSLTPNVSSACGHAKSFGLFHDFKQYGRHGDRIDSKLINGATRQKTADDPIYLTDVKEYSIVSIKKLSTFRHQ